MPRRPGTARTFYYESKSLATLGLLELSGTPRRRRRSTAASRRVAGRAGSTSLAGGWPSTLSRRSAPPVSWTEPASWSPCCQPTPASGPSAEACPAASERRFERAIELVRSVGPAPSPFRQGSELLLLGRLLRQAQQKRAARETLEQAGEIFERLDARSWFERTRSELRRIGGRRSSGGRLSETEEQIVDLVDCGSQKPRSGRRVEPQPEHDRLESLEDLPKARRQPLEPSSPRTWPQRASRSTRPASKSICSSGCWRTSCARS